MSNLDPNQLYTVTDQLRMDMRGIELDLHWHLGRRCVVCHGQPVAVGPTAVHAGCSVDRGLAEALRELRAWLDRNPDEVVLLYLENNLDGVSAAHSAAAAALAAELGSLVLPTPAGSPCGAMPLEMSRASIRATGARVLIVGNCGPGGWGTFVHERGPQWDESGLDHGDDYSCSARSGVGRLRDALDPPLRGQYVALRDGRRRRRQHSR